MTERIEIPAWVDGALTPVEKLEVHQKGLRHRAVSVFVLDGDRTLIQRRALTKYHTPGLWANSCCTHPHWGEAPEVCALRRVEEELGMRNLALGFRQQVEYRADVGGGLIEHEVVDIFTATALGPLNVRPNPDEVMEVRWIRLDRLLAEIEATPERFTPWLRIYMREFRGAILGDTVAA